MLVLYIDLLSWCKNEEKQNRKYLFEDICDSKYVVAWRKVACCNVFFS
jgi:hypothetical protein